MSPPDIAPVNVNAPGPRGLYARAARSFEEGVREMLEIGRVDLAREIAFDVWAYSEAAKAVDPHKELEKILELRKSEPQDDPAALCYGASNLLREAQWLLEAAIRNPNADSQLHPGMAPQEGLDHIEEALAMLEPEEAFEPEAPKPQRLRLVK